MRPTLSHLAALLLVAGSTLAASDATALPARVQAVDASATVGDHGPEHLFDGNSYRPWIAPFTPSAPPSLEVTFDRARWIHQVRFTPGHAGSNRTFEAHARPARVRVSWDGGARTFELDDRRHRHALDLGHLVTSTRLSVTVEAVHGPVDVGVAITDLFILDHRAPEAANPQAYQRFQRYLLALADERDCDDAQRHLRRFGDKASPALAYLVATTDGPLRLRALESLVAVGDAIASSVVGDLLAGDPPATMLALTVLIAQPLDGFADRLLALASGPDDTLARPAFRALARAGGPVAHDAITAAIVDPARWDRGAAALGELPPSEALATATALLDHSEAGVRERALAGLAPIARSSADALALIVGVARGGSERDRVAAIGVLAQVPGDATRELLVEVMRTARPRVARAATAAFLAQTPDGERFIAASIDSLRPAVVEHAVELMRDRHSVAATDLLVRALASGVWEPWYAHAAELLGLRGEPGVSAVVHHLVDHPRDERIVRHFLVDHARLAPAAAVAVLERVRRSRAHTAAKALLLEILRDSGDPRGAPIAHAMYTDTTTEGSVRRVAFETLTAVGSGPEIQALILASLNSDDPHIRRVAYAAAGRHRIEAALPQVRREITGTRPAEWTPGVVAAFGDLGGPNAIALLKRHYPVAPQSTRLAILDAAWRSGSTEGIELLVDAMTSTDRETSRVARALLERHR